MVRRRKLRNEIVVYDTFNMMDVVFVKIRGFVPWPSQIREIFENRLYFVEYFGSRWTECEWVHKNKISPIGPLENNPMVRKHAKHKEFMEAWDYGRNILEMIRNTEEAELFRACNDNLEADHLLRPSMASGVEIHAVDGVAIEAVDDDQKHKMKHCVVVLNRMPVSNLSTSISVGGEEEPCKIAAGTFTSAPAKKQVNAIEMIEPPSKEHSKYFNVALEPVNEIANDLIAVIDGGQHEMKRCVVVLNRFPVSAVRIDEPRRIIAVARKSVVQKEKSERSATNIPTVTAKTAKKRVNAQKLIELSPPARKRSKRTQRAPKSSTQK